MRRNVVAARIFAWKRDVTPSRVHFLGTVFEDEGCARPVTPKRQKLPYLVHG